jgi:hypothetical protein
MNSEEQSDRPGEATPDDRTSGSVPAPQPPPEVHRERELIVTGGGDRGSGPGTVVMVIFALVALVVITFLTFTFLDRSGDSLIPDEIDIEIELPGVGGSDGTS